MKKTKFLSLFLVLVMLLSTLASCGGGDQTTTQATTTTTTTTTTQGAPTLGEPPVASDPANNLARKLIDEGFVIVGAELASAKVNTATATVVNFMKAIDKWGTVIKDDFEAREAGAKEIQIGTIRREGTTAIETALAANRVNSSKDWRITVTADTISIIGATDDGLCVALNYFAKMLEANATDYYPTFDSDVQRFDWPVKVLGNAPVESFKIVLPENATPNLQTTATTLQNEIFSVSGFILPIIDDSQAAGANELALGMTNRPVTASATAAMAAGRTAGESYSYDSVLFAQNGSIALHGGENGELDAVNIALENFVKDYLKKDAVASLTSLSQLYQRNGIKELSFTMLADFHYIFEMYMSNPDDLQQILDRADDYNSDFVMHLGDFCNDYAGSPELFKTYLQNSYDMPAYGVYGNHELERNNTMSFVTTQLNNRDVIWGTDDGQLDPNIAYYYFDLDGFRIIGLDSNYSWNEAAQQWQHNTTGSYGPPTGNTKINALGPTQLAWLKDVLMDAAEKDLSCITFSHAPLGGAASGHSADAIEVQKLFKAANEANPGTVLMAVNGHIHTNHNKVVDNVLYWDLNVAINGAWRGKDATHYGPEHTFEKVTYDANGNEVSREIVPIDGNLSNDQNCWYFEDPLSANVTISTSGRIIVEGTTTDWLHGISPYDYNYDPAEGETTPGAKVETIHGEEPWITSDQFDLSQR